MHKTETITTQSGFALEVEAATKGDQLELCLKAPADKNCLLHWGVRRQSDAAWQVPAETLWPPGSVPAAQGALETPFPKHNGQANLVIRLSPASAFASLNFVLFFPDEKRWDNNRGQNYQIALQPSVADTLRELIANQEITFERVFEVDGNWQLAAAVSTAGEQCRRVSLLTNFPGELVLHWGVAQRSPREWLVPSESVRGKDTIVLDNSAQTPFHFRKGFNFLQLEFPGTETPLGIQFVLKQAGDDGRWLKQRGGNFYVPTQPPSSKTTTLEKAELAGLADEIIKAETSHNSWTLMHRFNLCYDFLDRVDNDPEGFGLLYVWLRFSAIRQLTWQRNYNTKPRELAHAQDRLTGKLADIYRTQSAVRPLVRLTLATVGRGGEGQRIRDEVLNIMHRHHVKEVSGHFLEEWHQKLHNNTTPDDIVICQAFLEFLRSNGNLDRFYQTLEAGGVTRERLESFERPIRSQPQFVPHLKDGLIHDFQNFLTILKASHSGTDLETSLNAARNHLDQGLQQGLNYLWEHRDDQRVPLPELVRKLTDTRRDLSKLLLGSQNLRELLYLDLALEQMLRGLIERNIHLRLKGESLADLVGCVLENVTLSYEDAELAACSRHWQKLQSLPRFDAPWSLHAKSVVDRIARALAAWMDHIYQLLQPRAEYLGHGFQAEDWIIKLFSEEVVRGSSLGFVLSVLLRHLDPVLRKAAHLGDWQVVSPGRGAGRIEVVEALRSVQRQRFDGPTVIITDSVNGDEDIPEGVVAVLAPDVTDIVSHVAVRARNAHLLFASCHDEATLARLKSMRGRFVHLDVSPAGDVLVKETAEEAQVAQSKKDRGKLSVAARSFTKYALGLNEFNEAAVGGKASHLAQLRGKLSDSIHLPASVAVPFGVFEKVLDHDRNKQVASRCSELAQQAEEGGPDVLARLRETILTLAAPDELMNALHQAMTSAKLAWPDDREKVWLRIKQVWASKWNERAFLSRKRMGFPHDRLYMAVLIQEVVPADYAFVVHTVNPFSGNANELFAEIVLGLGETLVGNYPGRALSFVWDKTADKATLLSYPGKSTALYGSGLIFRSDSNGEDLEGYAGAGLYDSVLLDPPRQLTVDYIQEPLVWQETFRTDLFARVANIGREVEKACGSNQDIEGGVTKGNYYVVQTRPQVGLSKTDA